MLKGKKIVRLSQILQVVCSIAFCLGPIIMIPAYLMGYGTTSPIPTCMSIFIPPNILASLPPLNEMGSVIKAVGFLAYFQSTVVGMLALGFLAAIFNHYRKLQIFSKGSIRCIRSLGYVILLNPLLDMVFSLLVFLNVPSSFPIPEQVLKSSVYGSFAHSLDLIGFSLCVILISWIMEKGKDIQEEQEHTV